MAEKIFADKDDVDLFARKIEAAFRDLRSGSTWDDVWQKVSNALVYPANDDRTAMLIFSPMAYSKMMALVAEFSTELAWRGVVECTQEGVYFVKDILVFPQTVTGTTVDADPASEAAWFNELSDEVYNSVRLHGHSHVNMGTTPSSTDRTFREDLLKTISKGDTNPFYCFVIANKKGDINCEIYDLRYNAHYVDEEINVTVVYDDGSTLWDFIEAAKKDVVEKRYQPVYEPVSALYGVYSSPTRGDQK